MSPGDERVIVTLSGEQSPGALANVMQVLSASKSAKMLDFGQLVVRNRYTATALIAAAGAEDVVKEILFRAHALDIQVDFHVASRRGKTSPSSSESSLEPDLDDYVLTVFSVGYLEATLLAKVMRILDENQARVLDIRRVTEEGDAFMCLEMRVGVDRNRSVDVMQKKLFELGRKENDYDIALQRANVTRKAKRMIVFDLSWTLVQCDAINVLLKAAGREVDAEVEKKYTSGELTGEEWLKKRVNVLAGLKGGDINAKAIASLTYTDGAKELCKGLKVLGCKVAVISSGSQAIADAAKEALGFDFAFGNVVEVDSAGCFTGTVKSPIVGTDRKAELVAMLAMQERVDMEQVVAVGDGAVSAKMLGCVGMSIAFDQPDAIDQVSSARISSKTLASVLYLLGVPGHDLAQVCA